jgi:hypothetical protein
MKALWAGVALSGLLATSAIAETRYDRRIEQAAMDIVAAKIGDIRGGFSFDAKPAFVTAKAAVKIDPISTRSISASADPWKDGLAPAVERKVSQIVF